MLQRTAAPSKRSAGGAGNRARALGRLASTSASTRSFVGEELENGAGADPAAFVHRFESLATPRSAPDPHVFRRPLGDPGQSLDRAAQARMGIRFGRDFSNVRIHDNHAANVSARSVDALAFTVGNHVVFADGGYAPGTPAGEALLAHELAHVIQQGGQNADLNGPLAIVPPTAPSEQAVRSTVPGMAPVGVARQVGTTTAIPSTLKPAELEAEYGRIRQWLMDHKGHADYGVQMDYFQALEAEVNKRASAAKAPPAAKPPLSAADLEIPRNASMGDIVERMRVIDAIRPSTVASGVYTTTFRGREIRLNDRQVSSVRAAARKNLDDAVAKAVSRSDSAVGRYKGQEQVNADFPIASRAAKAWAWVSTFGEYENPAESVYGQAGLVNFNAGAAKGLIAGNRFADAMPYIANADAASERTSKIVSAYINQLIEGGEQLVTGLTYTRNAAFITVGVLAVVVTGGAALGVSPGVVGTGVGGLTVAQTATALTVGAPIVARLGEAGVKLAYGDKVDWGKLALDTAVDIVLARFGGRLTAGIAGKLIGNPATASLARQFISQLVANSASHALTLSFRQSVDAIFERLRGNKNVTWEVFVNSLVANLTDPKGWFLVLVASGVQTAAQVKISSATGSKAGTPPVVKAEKPPTETGKAGTPPVVKAEKPPTTSKGPKGSYTGGGEGVRAGRKRASDPEVLVRRPGGAGGASGLGLSPSEQALVAESQRAAGRLGKPLSVKVKAATEEGTSKVQRSGSGAKGGGPELTQKVLKEGEAIGHKFAKNSSIDEGIPGQSAASHAEKLAALANPGRPLAVDKAMCPDCFAFFQRLAIGRGQTLVVNEPNTRWIFRPDGARVGVQGNHATVLRPDGTASSGPMP
jgi:hypothetical protein